MSEYNEVTSGIDIEETILPFNDVSTPKYVKPKKEDNRELGNIDCACGNTFTLDITKYKEFTKHRVYCPTCSSRADFIKHYVNGVVNIQATCFPSQQAIQMMIAQGRLKDPNATSLIGGIFKFIGISLFILFIIGCVSSCGA